MSRKNRKESEVERWTRIRTTARERLLKVHPVRDALKAQLAELDREFTTASNQFVEADRKLAELEHKVRVIPAGVSGRKQKGGGVIVDPRLMDKAFVAELLKLIEKEK